MGRIQRDLGFRPDPAELFILSDTCGRFERQTRKRGTNDDRGSRSAGFLCQNEEKEKEQKAKSSRGLRKVYDYRS
eukprot:8476934-Heterocapsa_arctica.AAC.1